MSQRHLSRRINSHKKDDDFDFSSGDASDKLKAKGIYYLTGEIEQDSLLEVHQNILEKHLDPDWHTDIQLIINSVGGDCAEGWALVDLMDWVKMDVRTVGMGVCMSMGAILLSAGTPGKRISSKNCTIMVHKHMMGMYGKHDELISSMKESDDEYLRAVKFWIEHSKYTTETQVRNNLLTTTDNFLTSHEAYHHGIIDHVNGVPDEELKKSPSKSRSKRTYHKTK